MSEIEHFAAVCASSCAVDADISRTCVALEPKLELLCGPFEVLRNSLPALVRGKGLSFSAAKRFLYVFLRVYKHIFVYAVR